MTYFIPQKFKCPKCGFELMYSKSENYSFLPNNQDGIPFCYKCLIKVISNLVPLMERTSDKIQR